MDGNGRIDMLYEMLQETRQEMREGFARLESRIDRRLDNHGDRIADLEQQQAHLEGKVKAWAAVISAGVSAVSKWLFPGHGGQ